MTAKVFAKTFVANHKFIEEDFSIRNQNNHNAALVLVEILLTKRPDLIKHYFGKETLSKEMIQEIAHLVKTEERLEKSKRLNPLRCIFREEDWAIVTEYINKMQLFKDSNLTEEMVRALFMCKLSAPLVENNLPAICYLFDRLQRSNYVGRWQTMLERSKSICLSSSNEIVTAGYYSVTVHRYCHRNQLSMKKEIDDLIKRLDEAHSPDN